MSGLQDDLQEALSKIAGGMFVVFLGFLAATLFSFLERMVLFRGLSKSDYGVIMLAVAVLEFSIILAELGLRSGAPRFVSYYRGQRDEARIKGTVIATLKIGAISSCAFALILVLASNLLADILDSPQLVSILRIFAAGLPFFVMVVVLCSIFRGFDRVGVKAVFEDLVMRGFIAGLMLVVVLSGAELLWAAAALSAAAATTFVLLGVYAMRALPRMIRPAAPVKMGRALLLFSFPLALEAVLTVVMNWADTFMLGIFKTTEMVGAYNAAVPFATLLTLFLLSLSYIFLPVTTRLLSEGKREQIKGIYRSSTKWAFTLTLPLLLIYILFPRQVMQFFAGERYAEAAGALVILSLGMFVNVLAGPNGMTLVALGRSRLVLFDGVVGVLVNLVLCIVLIPPYGIEGAACATLASMVMMNALKSGQIYHLEGIHPFSSQYLKPVLLAALGAVATYPVFAWALDGRDWFLILLYPIYLAMVLLLLLLSRSLEVEDTAVISFILVRMRVKPDKIMGFLSRFVAGGSGRDGPPA